MTKASAPHNAEDHQLTPRSLDMALEAMWCYYRDSKSDLSKDIKGKREIILTLLREGYSPKRAFDQASTSTEQVLTSHTQKEKPKPAESKDTMSTLVQGLQNFHHAVFF